MRYPDGQLAKLGDEVGVSDMHGKVVCSLDTSEYTDDYPEQAWSYLQEGVLIDWDKQGLTHYTEPEAGMTLIRRQRPARPGQAP